MLTYHTDRTNYGAVVTQIGQIMEALFTDRKNYDSFITQIGKNYDALITQIGQFMAHLLHS